MVSTDSQAAGSWQCRGLQEGLQEGLSSCSCPSASEIRRSQHQEEAEEEEEVVVVEEVVEEEVVEEEARRAGSACSLCLPA